MFFKFCALSSTTLSAILLVSSPVQAEDPPSRVGRISYLEGTVSFHTADQSDWSYATLNYPVVSGNAFWTEPNGKSEVQIGAVEVRMDNSTEMEVLQLDNNATQLEVPQGVVNIHFSTPPLNGRVEVLTPVGPIELTQPGTYHIDAGQPTATGPSTNVQVTALEGQLEIRGPRSLLEVMPGETATLNGNPPTFALQEGNPTPFDDWALARERREEAHASAQYVSPHMTGYEDLDNYGQWSPDPTYGNVWYPTAVQADWQPYRYGHWAFVAPWGWTWVDDAPWGFAPFHYGRWAHVGERWGWVPGEEVERPVYAPALVAFIGGAGWNVALSLGNSAPCVGWVPLGPREVFHPYYPTSVNYARNINISNVNRTEINNITVNNIHNVNVTNYINRGAATVVPTNAFQQGQAVHKSFVHVSQQAMAQAQVTPTLAHITPTPAARQAGRPLPASAEARTPNASVGENVKKISESSSAPIRHMEKEAGASQTPHNSMAPIAPQGIHPARENAASPLISYSNHATPASPNHESNAIQENHGSSHAPGPQIHAGAPHTYARATEAQHMREALPKAEVSHPQQETRIAPTPKGWQRTPVSHAEQHPQAQHASPPHPVNHEEEHPQR